MEYCCISFFVGYFFWFSHCIVLYGICTAVKICCFNRFSACIVGIASDCSFRIGYGHQVISFIICITYLVILIVRHCNHTVQRIILILHDNIIWVCNTGNVSSFVICNFRAASIRQNHLFWEAFFSIFCFPAASQRICCFD